MTPIIKSLYKLDDLLSRDGISRTLKGRTVETGRTILVTQYDPKWITPQIAQALIESAERVRNLVIPGVFTTIDYHYDGTSFFVVYDAPHHCSPLINLLKSAEKQSFSQLDQWCDQLLDSLHGLETHGVFHGNLSLTNIMAIHPSQSIGLIHTLTHATYLAAVRNQQDRFDSLAFWAPEQVMGEHGNRYADMYAIGVLMYVFYSNQWPYEFTQSLDRMRSVQFAPPRLFQPLNPNLPTGIQSAISRALSKDPADRFHSFVAFKHCINPPDDADNPPLVIQNPVIRVVPGDTIKPGFSWTPRHTRFALIGALALGLAIVLNAVYIDWVTGIPISTVPQLKGKTPDDALHALAQANLKGEIAGEKVDFSVPEGVVVESKPTGNREVKEGRTVFLYIAKHSGSFLVPDLIGMSVSTARGTAPDAQFTYRVVSYQTSTSVPSGNIIAQMPESGTKIKHRGVISLIVSKGSDHNIVPTPDAPSPTDDTPQ